MISQRIFDILLKNDPDSKTSI